MFILVIVKFIRKIKHDAQADRLVLQSQDKRTRFARKETTKRLAFNAELTWRHQWFQICFNCFSKFVKFLLTQRTVKMTWFVEGVWWCWCTLVPGVNSLFLCCLLLLHCWRWTLEGSMELQCAGLNKQQYITAKCPEIKGYLQLNLLHCSSVLLASCNDIVFFSAARLNWINKQNIRNYARKLEMRLDLKSELYKTPYEMKEWSI